MKKQAMRRKVFWNLAALALASALVHGLIMSAGYREYWVSGPDTSDLYLPIYILHAPTCFAAFGFVFFSAFCLNDIAEKRLKPSLFCCGFDRMILPLLVFYVGIILSWEGVPKLSAIAGQHRYAKSFAAIGILVFAAGWGLRGFLGQSRINLAHKKLLRMMTDNASRFLLGCAAFQAQMQLVVPISQNWRALDRLQLLGVLVIPFLAGSIAYLMPGRGSLIACFAGWAGMNVFYLAVGVPPLLLVLPTAGAVAIPLGHWALRKLVDGIGYLLTRWDRRYRSSKNVLRRSAFMYGMLFAVTISWGFFAGLDALSGAAGIGLAFVMPLILGVRFADFASAIGRGIGLLVGLIVANAAANLFSSNPLAFISRANAAPLLQLSLLGLGLGLAGAALGRFILSQVPWLMPWVRK